MGKNATANSVITATLTTFEDHLRLALKHLHNPAWLGQHSPLAAPYFLLALQRQQAMRNGAAPDAAPLPQSDLHPQQALPSTTMERGQVLRSKLIEAAQALWGSEKPHDGAQALAAGQNTHEDAYHALILDLNYVHAFAPPPLLSRYGHDIPQSALYNEVLHISRASHDRHLQAALHRLAARVLSAASPAWHEQPVNAPSLLLGREAELAVCLDALQQGKPVNVVGATGVGKTVLGATLAQRWTHGPVCWLTLRPGLNTHLNSLLMMLGHFLQRQLGASALWAQWVAFGPGGDGAATHTTALALALLQDDVAAMKLRGLTPLMCIDDADVLAASTEPAPVSERERTRRFLDAISSTGAFPMLLMGQRAVISAEVDCTLGNLSLAQSSALLKSDGAIVDPSTAKAAHAATGGNPRLLSLLRHTTNLAEALTQLPARPSLAVLVSQALSRLPTDHQHILKTLCVFGQPAPLDVFGPCQAIVTQLAAQGWLELREPHSVGLPFVVGQLMARSLSPQQHEQLHCFAAQTYAARGEVTLAADHYVQAGHYEAALLAWLPHAERELGRGQAALALDVFSRMPTERLSRRFADSLAQVLAQLHRALGQPAEIVALAPPTQDEPLGHFLQQLGWAHEQLGHLEAALDAYAREQRIVGQWDNRSVALAASQARLALRQRDMTTAKREAQRAAYEAERVQGNVCDEAGEPDAAQAHFLQALAHAEALNDLNGIAITCNSLGVVCGRRGDGAAAAVWLARAAQGFEALGNRLQAEIVRSNLTALRTSSGEHAEALRVGAQPLAFFQRLGHAKFIASTAASLAESAMGVGDLAAATRYAKLVLAQEEAQFVPYGLYTLGDVQQARSHLNEARKLFLQAHDMAQNNDDPYMQAYAARKLGQVLFALGKKEASLVYLNKARQLFASLGMAREVEQTGVFDPGSFAALGAPD